MKWEEILCLTTIPVAILLAMSGLLGHTAWAIMGLCLAAILVAAIAVVRRLNVSGLESQFSEILTCERSTRYIGIDHEGALFFGDDKQYIKLESRQIAAAQIKINSLEVPSGSAGIELMRFSGRIAARDAINSFSLEITTRNPDVPQFTIHLLAKGSPRHPETLAVRRATKRAEYWLRNLRA